MKPSSNSPFLNVAGPVKRSVLPSPLERSISKSPSTLRSGGAASAHNGAKGPLPISVIGVGAFTAGRRLSKSPPCAKRVETVLTSESPSSSLVASMFKLSWPSVISAERSTSASSDGPRARPRTANSASPFSSPVSISTRARPLITPRRPRRWI